MSGRAVQPDQTRGAVRGLAMDKKISYVTAKC